MAQTFPIPVIPPGGVVKTESGRVTEGRWTDCNNIRFVRGSDGRARPRKVGGWEVQTEEVSNGIIRTLHGWRDLLGTPYMAAGSSNGLYIYDINFAQYDITPVGESDTKTNPISVTNGSDIVTLTYADHGADAGDLVIISGGAFAVGGITLLDGTYTILTVPTSATMTIQGPNNASSTASGGGNISIAFELPEGSDLGAFGTGIGVGVWGSGTWGTDRGASTLFTEPRVWSIDNFGQVMIACFNSGYLYDFDPDDGLTTKAQRITAAPSDCRFAFVTAERYVVALRDDMVISWCSQANYNDWTVDTDSTANTRTLMEGSVLVAGKTLGSFVSMIWSDAAAYLMQWTGDSYVYSTSVIGRNCGLISPNAVVTVAGTAYWMGANTFWMASGGSVAPMPNVNDIRDYVFSTLTVLNRFQCHAVYNAEFNEIKFTWTVEGDTAPSMYVIYGIDSQTWAPGTTTRSAGANFTQGDTRPFMADIDGHIYLHEEGVNADGAAIRASLELAPYVLSEGLEHLDIEGIDLDTHEQVGDITLTINTYDRLRDAAVEDTETETVADDAGMTDLRVSGRFVSMTLVSDEVDGHFQLGKPVLLCKKSGSRR
jgi:hypothetical protein